MHKSEIQKFAVFARRRLLEDVALAAAKVGIKETGIENPLPNSIKDMLFFDNGSENPFQLCGAGIGQRQKLVEYIRSKIQGNDYTTAYRSVMEEVAYTWFNRLIAIRFMEVNGYLPGDIRVLSSVDDKLEPDLVSHPFEGALTFDARETQQINDWQRHGRVDELFNFLFIKTCNSLHSILPGLFELTEDYTELLCSLTIIDRDGVVQKLVHDIPEEDWRDQVQIIGWLYQFYNSEPKEQVFANLKRNIKITKETIPAATQIFTPDWIVRYMVENSLGRLWLKGHPQDQSLKTGWKYYLEEAEQEPGVAAKVAELDRDLAALKLQEIKCIDPCCGSGHILVYLFDVLMQFYTRRGYVARDAVKSILENNLFGLDIDERAAQLSYFAIMMKARQYDTRIFSRHLTPRIYAVVESNNIDASAVEYFGKTKELKAAMETIVGELKDAKEYGSLIRTSQQDWHALYARFEEIRQDTSLLSALAWHDLLPLVQVAELLAQSYSVAVTNPPYMGGSGMGPKLSEYVKTKFPDSKSDLFACFMERGNAMVAQNCFNCMVTMQSWMFLSSFEAMRKNILQTKTIANLMHMENMVMGIAFGTAVTVMQNVVIPGYKGTYNQIKLCDIEDSIPKAFPVQGNRFAQVSTDNFSKIPGSPVAYWVGEKMLKAFEGQKLGDIAIPKQGLATGNNDKFLRFWHEVQYRRIYFTCRTRTEAYSSKERWFPCNKGGEFRKWYGNNERIVDWYDDGKEIRNYFGEDGKLKSRPQNMDYYFKEGMTWSTLSSGRLSMRYSPKGHIFETKGSVCFAKNIFQLIYLIGLMNSPIVQECMLVLSPTLDYHEGPIGRVPVIFDKNYENRIYMSVKENISLSKTDWDMYETSWDFQKHPLV